MDCIMFSRKEQALANKLYANIRNCQRKILTENDTTVKKVLTVFTYEYPDMFHINGFSLETSLLKGTVYPQYIYPHDKYLNLLEECSAEANEIIQKVIGRRLGDYDSALLVHDILAKRVKYKLDQSAENHSIVGALLYDAGCCESISRSYKFILDRLNIPCLCVIGTARDDFRGVSGPHMWNMVLIKEKWCHVDVTFDLPSDSFKMPYHGYFGLDDRLILLDHSISNELKYPPASSNSLEYFVLKKHKISNEYDLVNYFENKIKSKVYCFEAMLSESFPLDDINTLLNKALSKAMRQTNFSNGVSWETNSDKRNFHVKFSHP